MVFGCTVFAAFAQVLLKYGAQHPMPAMAPGNPATWLPFVMAMLGNTPLVFGYVLHGGNAMLLILALREGELSLLYPVYALSYVWVNLLSMYFFGEMMNIWKAVGIVLVIGGVALLGKASTGK
jgi:multidrug transporter EmrE-like cation transporter